jgi:hypothetical protein
VRRHAITDPLEAEMARILDLHQIVYTRPEKDKSDASTLDFYLPKYGLSIEVKAWSCERMHEQIRRSGRERSGVMVLIGMPAVHALRMLLEGR